MISFTPIGAPRSFVGPAASAARACAIALSGSSQTNASTRGSIPANRARHSRVHASLVVAPRVIACIQSLKFFTEPLLPNPHNYLKNDKLNYPPDKSNRRRLTIAANRRTLAPGRHSFTQRTQGGLAGRINFRFVRRTDASARAHASGATPGRMRSLHLACSSSVLVQLTRQRRNTCRFKSHLHAKK